MLLRSKPSADHTKRQGHPVTLPFPHIPRRMCCDRHDDYRTRRLCLAAAWRKNSFSFHGIFLGNKYFSTISNRAMRSFPNLLK
jgi:hypothetical protein